MGAEGVGLTNNVDCKICDDPEAFAMEAVELYNNSEMWTRKNNLITLFLVIFFII